MRRSTTTMKLTQLTHQRMTGRLDSTPESVLDWLEEQLEYRGIDAVVYTRYILSLLQDYDSDEEQDVAPSRPITPRDMNGFCCERVVRKYSSLKENLKPVTTNKWKHRKYRTLCPDIGHDCWPHYYCNGVNGDHQKKLAVVQCLKSASEHQFGIESFVDELCAKLKDIKLLSESMSNMTVDSKAEITNSLVKVSVKEQALKYYAAFPALSCAVDSHCHQRTTVVTETDIDVNNCQFRPTKNSSHKTKWNGQKIIEFMNTNNICGPLTSLTTHSSDPIENQNNVNESHKYLETGGQYGEPDRPVQPFQPEVDPIDSNSGQQTKVGLILESREESKVESRLKSNYFYCKDIESNVMDVMDVVDVPLLVNHHNPKQLSYCSVDDIQENDRFEELVNKFNDNIASIWSTTTQINDSLRAKNGNIWSFNTSLTSSESSVTSCPNTSAIDLWTPLTLEDLDELFGLPLDSLTSSVVGSQNFFSDDHHFNGNDWFDEDVDRSSNETNILTKEANRISLQNHQKNSPFIEFDSIVSSNKEKTELKINSTQPLSLASFVDQSSDQLSPNKENENLLISEKTHFQPIDQNGSDVNDSDEESVTDISDKEVITLVICSDKCPNNKDSTQLGQTYGTSLKSRPNSTSLGELASFMGPFDDDFESTPIEYCVGNMNANTGSKNKGYNISQKSNKSENGFWVDSKPKLSSIVETSAEIETEYQDLYQMINEVLRTGIPEEDNCLFSSSCLLDSEKSNSKSIENRSV